MVDSKDFHAKQFLPFDALKGFQDSLREKEEENIEKIELSDESKEELARKLAILEIGDKIKIRFYRNKRYIEVEGVLKKINPIKEKVILEDDIFISFDDILKIEKL